MNFVKAVGNENGMRAIPDAEQSLTMCTFVEETSYHNVTDGQTKCHFNIAHQNGDARQNDITVIQQNTAKQHGHPTLVYRTVNQFGVAQRLSKLCALTDSTDFRVRFVFFFSAEDDI